MLPSTTYVKQILTFSNKIATAYSSFILSTSDITPSSCRAVSRKETEYKHMHNTYWYKENVKFEAYLDNLTQKVISISFCRLGFYNANLVLNSKNRTGLNRQTFCALWTSFPSRPSITMQDIYATDIQSSCLKYILVCTRACARAPTHIRERERERGVTPV